MHGPQGPRTETWPQRTSRTDVSQWPPDWCHACSREPLDMVGLPDGRSDETFPKWSSRTACSLRRTASNRCVEQLTHAKTICMAKTWDMVRRTSTCEAAHMGNTLDVVYGQDVASET